MTYYQQQQVELNAKQEQDVLMLKRQINSLFVIFNGMVNYLKSDKINQTSLITNNDAVVSALDLFGVNCEKLAKIKSNRNTLIAAYAYFDWKKQQLDVTDARVIKDFLNYAECALLGKKLKEVQISQDTIDYLETDSQSKLSNFFSKMLGAKHKTEHAADDAKKNALEYRKQNVKAVQETQAKYKQRQNMIECPDQNNMYSISGGAQNIKFGSAMYTKNSKYKKPFHEQKNQKKADAMDVESNYLSSSVTSYVNAYVIKEPSRTITVNNKPIQIQYPHPCQVVPGKLWDNGQTVGVIYAKPNDFLRVKINISNLERDPVKVKQFEQQYIAAMHHKGNKPLGYESIDDQEYR